MSQAAIISGNCLNSDLTKLSTSSSSKKWCVNPCCADHSLTFSWKFLSRFSLDFQDCHISFGMPVDSGSGLYAWSNRSLKDPGDQSAGTVGRFAGCWLPTLIGFRMVWCCDKSTNTVMSTAPRTSAVRLRTCLITGRQGGRKAGWRDSSISGRELTSFTFGVAFATFSSLFCG